VDYAPLGVEADDVGMAMALLADLSQEKVDGVAGGRDGCPDHSAVVHDDVGVVRALHHGRRRAFNGVVSQ